MQRPTDNLRKDHALVARGMAALGAIAAAVRAGAAFPAADSALLLRFLREFVIAVHMRKESAVLFPAAAMYGEDQVAAGVGDALRVHAEVEELTHSLVLFWEPTADLDDAERIGFADTVQAVQQRLERLAELEETALFPLCDAEAPADDQLGWLDQFLAFERERTSLAAWQRQLAPVLARWCA
jgi:hemerythrin-like domain-containing protein